MAQTKRKRRTKHRGNAAGIVEHRGRTSRPPSPEERKKAARAARGDRYAKPLDPQWPICPYCEAEVPGHAPVPRRRRRRQATSEVEQGATASYEAPPSP